MTMHVPALLQFLEGLAENNNRPWFLHNKPAYDILREEFLELVTQVIAELGKFDAQVKFCNPKKAMFRINRDVRFAHDKSPYKTHFSAAIANPADHLPAARAIFPNTELGEDFKTTTLRFQD